eukprot:7140095-Pyramimonas_sp.AAC.1
MALISSDRSGHHFSRRDSYNSLKLLWGQHWVQANFAALWGLRTFSRHAAAAAACIGPPTP